MTALPELDVKIFAAGDVARCSPRCSVFSNVAASVYTLFALIALCSGSQSVHAASDRVALIMAVQDYGHFAKAPVPIATAQKLADALTAQGFDVLLSKNPNNADARAMLRDFAGKADGANAALVVLMGHGASSGGRTYFLPSNAEITRDSDLLSRALALPSVVQLVGRAKFGGVLFTMTVADISSTLQSISARPSFPGEPPENVVVVFSSSDKVPVSRVDRVSEQAAADLADAAAEKPLLAEVLVNAAAAGGVGKVYGKVPALDLSKAPEPVVAANPSSGVAAREVEARRDAERRAREAEERVRDAEARARDAEERARAEARRAQDATAKSAVLSERGTSGTPAAAQPAAPADGAGASDDTDSLRVVEALFGRAKRKRIQFELKKRAFYTGPIDAIFGDLTRQAIMEYQKSLGVQETGYLTPLQLQDLVGS
ncbi:MAG: peptidoglycan-binding protein [Hyphomicrobiaceae bacterium]|nr:peptidoglycan-binding protein [Hyphomicrobiaceae bacterium]